MKTKHFFPLAFAAALAILTACNKENSQPVPEQPSPESQPSVTVRLDISSATPLTRATVADTEDEAKVNAVDYFVFKASGGNWIIETYKHVNSGTHTELTLTQGTRRICAIVNPTADYSGVALYGNLISMSTALKDQALDSFTMFGYTDQSISASTTEISVPVNRIAARVKIHKITNALTNATLAAGTFQITRIFLRRVPGEALFENYPGTYNKYAVTGVGNSLSKTPGTLDATTEKPRINSFIYKALDTPATVAHNASYTTPHSFYSFPMYEFEDLMSLIVEIKIGSQFYTYPVELKFPIDRNRSYEINELRITRPGNPSDGDDTLSDDETNPIEFVTVDNVHVSVNDWTLRLLGTSGTVEF